MEKSARLSPCLDSSAPTRPFAPKPPHRLPAIHLDSWDFRKIAREGSVLSNALIAWDVDADGVEEIIFGTTEGHLIVVKPDHRIPVYRDVLPATISVVLYSVTYRRLVVITLEGQCKITEDFLLSSSTLLSSFPCSASCTRLPAPQSTGTLNSKPTGRGDHETSSSAANHTSKQNVGSSFTFSIVPNCMCGTLGLDDDDEMVFLGSYDHRIYVYSLNGICMGSISIQAPVSSLRYFAVPLFNLSSTAGQTVKVCSNRTATQSSAAAQSQGEAPATDMPTCLSMLLVSCSRRIVLLNASRADVKKWVATDSPHFVTVQYEDDDCLPVGNVKPFIGPVSQKPFFTVANQSPILGSVSSHLRDGIQHPNESLLSGAEDNEQGTNTLKPVWQMHINSTVLETSSSKEDKYLRPQSGSSIPSRIFSYESPSPFFQHDSTECVVRTGDSSSLIASDKGQLGAMQDLRFPLVVDVAVGQSCIQFAAASEDGRCYVLEMRMIGTERESDRRVRTGETGFDRSSEPPETAAKVVSIGSELQLEASICCIWAGVLTQQALVSRVYVFNVQNNEFCSVFVATDGTCYALDSGGKLLFESQVKADVSSFTIMTGGSTTHPMLPLACPTFTACDVSGARDSTLGANVLQHQQQQQQQNLLRGPIGRIVSLVCVSVDELVIFSVGGESYLSASTSIQGRSSPLTSVNLPEYKRGVEQGNMEADDTLSNSDEEEEVLMLQLGTLLLEAQGCVDHGNLFTAEERRFVARKMCAYGYSHDEWKVLEQIAENISE